MRYRAKFEALVEIGNIINETLHLDKLLDLVLHKVTKAMSAEASSILLLEDEDTLYFKIAIGEKGEDVKKFRLKVGEGIGGWVVREGKPLLIDDVERDSRFKREISECIKFKVNSMICVPLKVDGRVIGAIEVMNRVGGGAFAQEDLEFLLVISEQLAKSIRNARLYAEVNEENEKLRNILELKSTIVGSSKQMMEVLSLANKVSKTDAAVLVTGKTGTGKELVARVIHENSSRAKYPFVEVNCAAMPDTLLESELFGYEKGAFTGAVVRKKGKFELADKGTLFLDEIGDMSQAAQAKLLRVLQVKRFERLGGTEKIKVDIRIIAATNRDLVSDIKDGRFREDLYYRINEVEISLPTLSERSEDIPELVNYFIKTFNEELGKKVKGITGCALDALMNYSWPGNVRELKNVIKRVMVLMDGDLISLENLPFEFQPRSKLKDSKLEDSLESVERAHIMRILERTNWNKLKAASILNISRPRLDRKIFLYGIKRK